VAVRALRPRHTLGHLTLKREAGPFIFSVTAYPGGAVLPSHQHRDAYLCLALQGEFEERADGKQLLCPSGTLLAHPPGRTHENRFGSQGAACLNIFPQEAWLATHLRRFPFGTEASWTSRRLEALGQGLLKELRAGDAASSLAAESLALEILAEALRSGAPRGQGHPIWLSRVIDLIEADPSAPLGLSELAEAAGVSPGHLARSIRARFHMSLGAYVRERRLERARDLILRSRHPLNDIAAQTGFYDQSHFNRAFKARFGLAPSALRG
jgi:AraC family transcriptional regulator